tara:strand:- start:78 stop:296 length:219 start_codon:yes stop_codon:yes gene_type:complete
VAISLAHLHFVRHPDHQKTLHDVEYYGVGGQVVLEPVGRKELLVIKASMANVAASDCRRFSYRAKLRRGQTS